MGKTSLSRKILETNNRQQVFTTRHIEYDGVEDNLTEEGIEGWRKSRTAALEQLESLLKISRDDDISTDLTVSSNTCITKTNAPRLILMDDNFYLRSMRKQVYQLCQKVVQRTGVSIHFGIVWMTAHLAVSLERNQQRGRRMVADSTVQRMFQRIEEPSGDFVFERSVLHLATDQLSVSQQVERFQQFLSQSTNLQKVTPWADPQNELNRIQQERELTKLCSKQMYDQQLRRCVQILCQHDSTKFAKNANLQRKRLLQHPYDITSATTMQFLQHFCQGMRFENPLDEQLAFAILKEKYSIDKDSLR